MLTHSYFCPMRSSRKWNIHPSEQQLFSLQRVTLSYILDCEIKPLMPIIANSHQTVCIQAADEKAYEFPQKSEKSNFLFFYWIVHKFRHQRVKVASRWWQIWSLSIWRSGVYVHDYTSSERPFQCYFFPIVPNIKIPYLSKKHIGRQQNIKWRIWNQPRFLLEKH